MIRAYPPRRQLGYLLVATLWLLVLVTVAATYFAQQVGQAVRQAQRSQDISAALAAMESARAEILFRLGTTALTVHGLGGDPTLRLALDGQRYIDDAGVSVALQDARGLLNINFPKEFILVRLLSAHGVNAEHHSRLVDTLRDYTDIDDLHRLNGAEKDEYLRHQLPPPPNDLLVVVEQLPQILGWRDHAHLWQDRAFLDLLSTSRVEMLNLNTAPEPILAALPGATPELASQIVKMRQQQPLRSFRDVLGLTDQFGAQQADWITYYPGQGIRVTIAHPDVPWQHKYEFRLTPNSEVAPWRVDSYMRLAKPKSDDEKNSIPLPPRQPFISVLDATSL
ncbi:MAG: type II secretion system protein GspK [Anderseniella sp.]|jgi:type II secretory pathway component PulK|nr:type II secretion system protein GspK [Anderseniella sp.]